MMWLKILAQFGFVQFNSHPSVSENLTPDEANWSVFIPGLEFEDTWGPYSEYPSW